MHTFVLQQLDLVVLLTGAMLFAHWFVYCLGSPLAPIDHVDAGAILFFIPFYFARERLRGAQLDEAVERWRQERTMTGSGSVSEAQALRSHRLNVLEQGRQLFTWERSLLCPVCLHFWLSLVTLILWVLYHHFYFSPDLYLAGLTYLFLHLIIRKI